LAASSRQAELVAFCANTDLGRKAAGSCAIPSSGTFRVFTDCHDGRRLLNARALKRKEPMAEELRIQAIDLAKVLRGMEAHQPIAVTGLNRLGNHRSRFRPRL